MRRSLSSHCRSIKANNGLNRAYTLSMKPSPSLEPPVSDTFHAESRFMQFRSSEFSFYEPTSQNAMNRFVAGSTFYNYQDSGALRPGGAKSFISLHYCGVLAASFTETCVYSAIRTCLGPKLYHFVPWHAGRSGTAVECLLNAPTSFSFLYGLISDVIPMQNYRRKPYMIIGCMISLLALIGLIILSVTRPMAQPSKAFDINIGLTILAATGTLMSKVAVDAQVIEFSQQEPLESRGLTAINYLIFRKVMEGICVGITTLFLRYKDPYEESFDIVVSPIWIYSVLAGICMLMMPIVYLFNNEAAAPAHGKDIAERADVLSIDDFAIPNRSGSFARFVQICRQRAVWQLAIFVMILVATTQFHFIRANLVLEKLASVDHDPFIYACGYRRTITICALFAWKMLFINRSWRKTVLSSCVVCLTLELFRNIATLYVVPLRQRFFFVSIYSLMGVRDATLDIFTFIPVTEIADYGSEGAITGLLSSFRCIVGTLIHTICVKINSGYLDSLKVSSISQLSVIFVILAVIRSLACGFIGLLPRQKLDAQQLRVYGGYSALASVFLWSSFCMIVLVAVYLNISTLLVMLDDDGGQR